MIAAISGKIGSGKDTVGLIIQYLSLLNQGSFNNLTKVDGSKLTLEDHFNATRIMCNQSTWQIKKFADKLKECVSIITGISRADLEKSEVKNKVLGEEWIRYGYADGFIKKYIGNGEMGEPIMNHKQCTKERYEEEFRTNWQTAYKHEYTVRDILQLFGTEVGRSIHNDVWVNALFVDYKPIDKRTMQDPDDSNIIYPNWIITDMRFENELKAVKDRGGITIRLNRKGYGTSMVSLANDHPSETALDNATFDYEIDNHGSIENLIEMVKEILIKEKII